MDPGLVLGVIGIGLLHGVLPDHGWPIAATYALEFRHKWVRGTLAAVILGVGHLISSVALVAAYYWINAFADFADGPWMRTVAGTMLVVLGLWTYYTGGHGGHDHLHQAGDHDGDEDHDGHDHDDARDTDDPGLVGRVRSLLGGHQHLDDEHAQQGLAALGVTALALGFAHEEPLQILAICTGTAFCLELMLVYSLAVIAAIVAPTLLLVAGYERHRARMERYTPYMPAITAAVLILMGVGFLLGLFG